MKKNILYGDLILQDGKSKIQKNECVFKEGDEHYKGMKIIEVLQFKVVGQTSNTKQYTEVKASEEKRNNITGAYE